MKIKILVENNIIMDKFYKGEPGLSMLIEADGKKILFDTGFSGVFLDNALKMGYNLLNLDYIVLSHSHFDHTWGLSRLVSYYSGKDAVGKEYITPKLITHPGTFKSRTVKNFNDISPQLTKDKLQHYFSLNLSKEPVYLTDNLVFLGEIERENNFEAQKPLGKVIENGKEVDDYIIEDSALAYNTKNGIIIITGCSHAGICNIIKQAKEALDENKIVDIIGGFHLINPTEKQLNGTINYLNHLSVEHIHPCHCTDFHSKVKLNEVLKIEEVGVGFSLEY